MAENTAEEEEEREKELIREEESEEMAKELVRGEEGEEQRGEMAKELIRGEEGEEQRGEMAKELIRGEESEEQRGEMGKELIGREEREDEVQEEMEKEGNEERSKTEKEEEEEAPSHLPFAPESSDVLDDDSTTVDPSYIISLIRKLLPCQSNADKESQENDSNHEEEKIGENGENLEKKDQWEESGCILWDLAASKTQAEFMVNNFLLEVLLANLQASESFRIKEICLGIIGNLACHDTVIQKIISQNNLIETVILQLILGDSPCLTETFRVLESGIKSSEYSSFAELISSNEILERILWIFGNTLNLSLFEKCVDFLFAVIESEKLGNILLQPLIKLGLNTIAVNLFISEINKSEDENKLERSDRFDVIINLIEALSALDGFLKESESSEKLLQSVCNIIKHPDKFEVSSYYASAILIIANLLAEKKNLISIILNDIPFLEGLFDALPLLPNDPQPKNALWCVISTLLVEINENNKLENLSLDQIARVLLSKTEIIEDYVADQVQGSFKEDLVRENYLKVYGVKTSLRRIGEIIEKRNGEKSERINSDEIERVNRLLNCCSKCDEL
ncbi:hypothetical protein LUZ60_005279 [Juncus effusus]|nr:hypothetical protein LUZ60_005279 [Juncus effusus]